MTKIALGIISNAKFCVGNLGCDWILRIGFCLGFLLSCDCMVADPFVVDFKKGHPGANVFDSKNVSFSQEGLVLSGHYENDGSGLGYIGNVKLPQFSYDQFSVFVSFKPKRRVEPFVTGWKAKLNRWTGNRL